MTKLQELGIQCLKANEEFHEYVNSEEGKTCLREKMLKEYYEKVERESTVTLLKKMMKKLLVILTLLILLTGCSKGRIVEKTAPEIIKMFDDGESFVMYAGTSTCETCK